MKQIASFNIARLRVEEDFGFLKLVVAETGSLVSDSDSPDEISVLAASAPTTLATSVATFKNAVDAFDDALKDSATVPSTALAAEADAARDNAWRAANNYLKAMAAHPTESLRRTATEFKTLFDKYGDPTLSFILTESKQIIKICLDPVIFVTILLTNYVRNTSLSSQEFQNLSGNFSHNLLKSYILLSFKDADMICFQLLGYTIFITKFTNAGGLKIFDTGIRISSDTPICK